MLEQEHGNGDIAHHLEAEDDDRPRHRADTAAARRPVVGGIDQPQQLVGQREILEDGIGELVHALVIAAGDAVNGSNRLRQRREITLVSHAPKEEIDCRLPPAGSGYRLIRRIEIVVQRLGKLRRSLVTQAGVAGNRLEENGAQTAVDADRFRQANVVIGDTMKNGIQIAALHRALPSQHFKEHQTGRIEIGALADLVAQYVLWRHVGRRTGIDIRIVLGPRRRRGDAEIHHPRIAILVEQDVRGLEVAVDDALCVGMANRIKDWPQQGHRPYRRQGTALLQEFGQVFSGHALEDQIDITIVLAGFINRDDVRMPQATDHPRLGKQRRTLLGIPAAEMQGLDRHLALQLRIKTTPDDALGSPSEFTANLEATDTGGHTSSGTIHTRCGIPSAPPQTIAFCP